MFHLEGVVFIALLCTATAVMVRVDGYDVGTEVEQSVMEVSTCKNEDCDAECRSIGCARGQCAGDDCYCDIWRSINETKLSHNTVEKSIKAKRCDDQDCDQQCRRHGFINGRCIDDFCTCTAKRDLNVQKLSDNTVEKSIKAKRCDDQDCDQQCRRHGFINGRCIDDFCTCTAKRDLNVQKLRDNILGLKRTIENLNKCNEFECYQECIKFGYISGTCVGNTCTCKIRLSEVSSIKRTIENLNKCNEFECYQECIKFGYISGTCVGNTCTCKIRLSDEMTIAKDVKNLKDCWDNQCDLYCSEHGYISGRCIDNHCKCRLFRGTTIHININKLSTCNSQDCDQQCHNSGSSSGNCVGDSCVCTEAISKIEDNEVTSNEITKCTQNTCRSVCQDLGHSGGKCFLGKCQCNIKLGPLFQVLINDESEEKGVSVVAN